MQWLSNFVGQAAGQPTGVGGQGGQVLATSGHAKYFVGEVVDYYSASSGTWIPATVTALNARGTYNLDCKPDVSAEKIRKRAASTSTYAVGEVVEYYSASQNGWILATVLATYPGGTYDLDCKPIVAADSIRKAPPGAVAAATTAGTRPGSSSQMPTATASSYTGSASYSSPSPPSLGAYSSPTSFAPAARQSPLINSNSTPIVQDGPVQLLKVQRQGSGWRYEVCPEGARVLESHGSRHISVASICGLYRTGKSYLLNLLLERVQKGLPLFQVGGTTRACTEGLWLWGSISPGNERGPLLAFLDCEGFGSTDSDRSRDAQLMTLCCLLSSVLVLNTKGALNEGLFNSLALTCKFAEHIEQRGNEASRPHLLWVLRDFVLELVDSSGAPITPDQYLDQALAAAPLAGHDQARSQGAREVRENLVKFFDRRGCTTLVQPVIDEEKLQKLQEVPYTQLRGEFQSGVNALRTQLVSTCNAQPKAVGGQPLSCVAFVGLMKQLVVAINENKMLSVKGAWEAVQHSACIALTDELRTSACATLRSLSSGERLSSGAQLPMSDDALQQALKKQRHEVKAEFHRSAVGDEAVRREYWQELKEALVREEAMVKQRNQHEADKQLMEALRGWQSWLNKDPGSAVEGERVVADLGTLFERMPSAALSRTSKAALDAALRRLVAAKSSATAASNAWASSAPEAPRDDYNARPETKVHLESAEAELKDAKAQLQTLTSDIAGFRDREHDLKSQQRLWVEREASLRAELDQVRGDVAKNVSERTRLEEQVRLHGNEKRRLEESLEQERGRVRGGQDHITKERMTLQEEVEKTRTEHLRMLEEARRRADEDRKSHATTMEGEKNRLLESERAAGLLEGQVAALTAEKNLLHHRVGELENQLREAESNKGRSRQEQEALQSDIEKLKKETDSKDESTRAEVSKRVELEKRLQEVEGKQPKCGCIVQ